MRQVPAQVGLPFADAAGLELALHLFIEFGLGDIDGGGRRQAESAPIRVPAKGGSERRELRARVHVEELVRVAQFDAGEGGFGQAGLDGHHGLRAGARRVGRIAQQLQHGGDVLQIFGADLLRLDVGI